MSLSEKIGEDLKNAIKAKDEFRVSCLRMLKTAVKHKQIERGRELKDEEIRLIISSSIRKNKDAAEEFRRGGREDLAVKEEKEIKFLYEYLPEQLTLAEIEKIVQEVISELSTGSPKDLGKVMKMAMSRVAGKAEGKTVNEIVRRLLN